jgi:hypothetical protein
VEAIHPGLVRCLEFAERRVAGIARKGGSNHGVIPMLKWLDAVLRDHAALDSEEGEVLRAELRGLVGRIRERA